MKRRIDGIAIKDTTKIISTQLNDLIDKKEKLKRDIKNILTYYKGLDAFNIVKKYEEKVDNLDTIIENLKNYIYYFNGIEDSYSENQEKIIDNLNPIDYEFNNLENVTLNMDVFYQDGDLDEFRD